jgi:sigma-B regulation protein RsbU (phosphoserine phosphatase)
MDILQRIERVSKAIEALSNEVKELKFLASEASLAAAQPLRNEGHKADTQLKIMVSYLALSPGMEEDALLNTLLTCAMTVVRAEGAAVTIYDDRKKALVFRAAVGIAADKLIGCEVPLGSSQHGIAFRMRQVIASTPMYKVIDGITGEDYRNVLAAPLIVNNEPIGTLGAVNKQTEDHFTPQDIVDYSIFAELAAHIIQQRLRENSLRELIEGDSIETPEELSGVNILTSDKDFLAITQSIATIGRRSPEMLSLCRQLIAVIANIT